MSAPSKRKLRALRDVEENPEGKRAQLQRVMHIGSVSNSSLTAILQGVGQDVRRDTDTVDVGQARFEALHVKLALPGIDGGIVHWEVCDPNLLVSRVVREVPRLQALFASAFAAHPCAPNRRWRLVLG